VSLRLRSLAVILKDHSARFCGESCRCPGGYAGSDITGRNMVGCEVSMCPDNLRDPSLKLYSPDHGSTAVLDRWAQLEPTILFADSAVFYNGRVHDSTQKLPAIVKGLPTLRHVVVLRKFLELPLNTNALELSDGQVWLDEEFLGSAVDSDRTLEFEQLNPDWPVYILFSSGTTGSMLIHRKMTLLQVNRLTCRRKKSQNAYATAPLAP